jgi:hypothetical protein
MSGWRINTNNWRRTKNAQRYNAMMFTLSAVVIVAVDISIIDVPLRIGLMGLIISSVACAVFSARSWGYCQRAQRDCQILASVEQVSTSGFVGKNCVLYNISIPSSKCTSKSLLMRVTMTSI